jgi:hypothetical protein
MPSIQRIWSGPGWFGTRRSMVQIHSPRPILLGPTTYSTEKCRRHPGCGPTSRWFKCARQSTSMSFSKLELSFKWCDAATTFSSFCSPRSPNRTTPPRHGRHLPEPSPPAAARSRRQTRAALFYFGSEWDSAEVLTLVHGVSLVGNETAAHPIYAARLVYPSSCNVSVLNH